MKTSKTIADVVRVGVCVDRDRIPCEQTQVPNITISNNPQ
jgi:hypothetical protein